MSRLSVAHQKPGQATLHDVAARAGVSLITASRALLPDKPGQPVRPATRTLVTEAATALGYRPNAQARAMRGRRHDQVGALVINNPGARLTNLAAYEYLLGLNAGLEAHGITLALIRLTDLDGQDPAPVRALREQMLDGFVAISRLPVAVVTHLEAAGDRVLWLDTDRDQPTACLRRDETAAGRLAAEALLAHGRRSLVLLRPSKVDHYSLVERERGVAAAAAAAGVDFRVLATDGSFLPTEPAQLRALCRPDTGLLLATPTVALRTLSLFATWGVVPGTAVGVAACDADEIVSVAWPDLTRVVNPRHQLGEQAAVMLVQLLGQGAPPASATVMPTLIAGCTA